MSVTPAGVAASQAATDSTGAHEAKVAHCKVVLREYNAQAATVEEMREYAGCVDTLHPSPLPSEAVIAMKALFIIAVIGMVVAAWRERKIGALEDAALAGLVWFLVAPTLVVIVAVVLCGLFWLFTT